MRKTRKKAVSILVALTFLLGLIFAYGGPAAAAYPVSFANSVNENVSRADDQVLGWIKIKVDPAAVLDASDKIYVTVTLPSGVEYMGTTGGNASDYVYGATDFVSRSSTSVSVYGPGNTSEFIVQFNAAGLSKVKVTSTAASEIKVSVTAKGIDVDGGGPGVDLNVWSASTEAVVGKIVKGEVAVSAASPVTVTEGPDKTAAKITLTENKAKVLSTTDQVYIDLPSTAYYKFVNASVAGGPYGLNGTASVSPDGKRITVSITARSSTFGDKLEITPVLTIFPGAPEGDISVNVSASTDKVVKATLTIAKIGKTDVALSTEDTATAPLYPAKNNQDVDTIVLKGSGNLPEGGTIILTLSTGTWANQPDIANLDELGLFNTVTAPKSMWYKVASGANVKEIKISGLKVNLPADAPVGNLTVTVSGSAGANGSVVVGEVKPRISVQADVKDVVVGLSQAAGDITITETSGNSLLAGDLVLTLPAGFEFAADAKFKVNDGSEKTAARDSNNTGKILLKQSDLALTTAVDTIKIYGIKYNLDTRVAPGNVEVAIGGSAVNELGDGKPVAKVVNAKVVAPVPPTKREASFVIGNKTYKVNGKEYTMDVEPYIDPATGRTMLPVRYAAYALGVSEDGIFYSDGVVSLLKGNRAVQMTIGSKTLVVNGTSIPMDAAPVIKDGRTMLPYRWVAIALGATDVKWDEGTKTVTVTIE